MKEISNNNGRVLEPELRDLLVALKKEVKLEINCISLGTIQSFNSSIQTANILINYKKSYKAITKADNLPGQAIDTAELK